MCTIKQHCARCIVLLSYLLCSVLLPMMPLWLSVAGSRQSSAAVDGRKHCLLMDEVDGMAGNEDRGGLQVQSLCYILSFVLVIPIQ